MAWFRTLTRISTSIKSSSPPTFADGVVSSPSLLLTSLSSRFSTSVASPAVESRPPNVGDLEATRAGEKPRVVVVGSGWAGCRLMKGIDTDIYDVVCVSPRNHMVFTPLLASTCVGTLEFRSVSEHVARIQPAISTEPGSYFFLSRCKGIDAKRHVVNCESVTDGENTLEPWKFNISYDKLVIALGAEATTFGIHGVKEHAIFLREVHHAQQIRRKLLLNLMLSDIPGTTEQEKSRLLHCVVVGGGPTGVEFSGELSDFIMKDVRKRHSHVKDYIRVTLIEANEILSSFDERLRHYATKQLTKSGVRLVRGIVKDVEPDKIVLDNGTEVPYGLLVWSTGVGPSSLVKSLDLPKSPGLGSTNGYGYLTCRMCLQLEIAVGLSKVLASRSCRHWHRSDIRIICCFFGRNADMVQHSQHLEEYLVWCLVQVAERQGKYLAAQLNRIGKAGGGRANGGADMDVGEPFVYKHMGSMASIGRHKALVDLRQSKKGKGISMAGFISWFIWRSAYLTRVVSWRNRFYVAVNWLTTMVFGRDISRL
ncbi:Internal alternative NAD(P)H-ubiquinone oxidoreductase A1, mitochondrial [Linum grandiflorum]